MAIDINTLKKVNPKPSETKGSWFDFLNKDIQLGGGGLNDKKKEAFYHELNILMVAGVDIRSTLHLIAKEQKTNKDKALFESIHDQVVAGATLSSALQQTGKFSSYEFYSIQIGEETGKLPVVLKELAEYFQQNIKLKRQLVSALTYPGIVLCTSFGAIFFMLNFIVPMFADIFKRFGGKLPAITAFIVSVSEFFSDWFILGFLLTTTMAILLYSQRKKYWFRNYSIRLVLATPILGSMVQKVYLARFCHSMSLLIASRIPLLRAMGLIKQMIGFLPIEESLSKIEKDILQGESLHKSMSAFPIYPGRMISLVKVGEEVNQLDNFFNKIAKQYTEDVEHQTGLISSMIEPFMIIFLGLIVGFILIAMYLPLFQLSNSF
jgi:type IV pilus assembly protein PilC